MITFTEKTQRAIRKTAAYIADEFEPTPELVLERLGTLSCDLDAAKEITALVKQHGWKKVAAASKKYI